MSDDFAAARADFGLEGALAQVQSLLRLLAGTEDGFFVANVQPLPDRRAF